MLQLLRQAKGCIGRRGRRQHERAVTPFSEPRRGFTGALAIEADHFERGTALAQAREIVGRWLADCRIEAADALAGAQHIPQAEAVRQQARQAFGIRQAAQVRAYERQQ